MNKFRVGDRVIAIKAVDNKGILIGKEGIVVHIQSPNSINIGVEFLTSFVGGHSCRGNGKDGYCRYGRKDVFKLADTTPKKPTKDGLIAIKDCIILYLKKHKLTRDDVNSIIKHINRVYKINSL